MQNSKQTLLYSDGKKQFKGVNQNLKNFSKSRRFSKTEDESSISSCDDIISYEHFSNGFAPSDIYQDTLLAKTKLSKMKRQEENVSLNFMNRSRSSNFRSKSCQCSRCLNLKNFEMEHSLGQKRNLKLLNNFLQKLNCLNVNSH